MKHIYVLILLVTQFAYAQNQGTQPEHWNLLLKNDREAGYKALKKHKFTSPLEKAISQEIYRTEMGQLEVIPAFLPNLTKYEGFENYMYALWNESYIFSNYREIDFTKARQKNIDFLQADQMKNQSVINSVYYMKGLSARFQKDWNTYEENLLKIETIRDWQFCGPFENMNNSGIDIAYEAESTPQSTTDFNANSNGFINWFTPKKSDPEAYRFYVNQHEFGYGVNYAQTFVNSPEEQRVQIRIGNSAKFKVWLNDVEILENNLDVETDMDAHTVEVTLPKGNNRLLIKNADGNGYSYFSARITDKLGVSLKNLEYNSTYTAYNSSSKEELNPKPVTHYVEQFLLDKKKENPNNFFYDYCLARYYLRNGNYPEAQHVIAPIYEAYPKSSILRKLLIETYIDEGDESAINDIKKNLEQNDSEYYLQLMYKTQENDALQRMTAKELEEFSKRFQKASDLKLMHYVLDITVEAKKMDQISVKNKLDEFIDYCTKEEYIYMIPTYANFYSLLYNDDDKTLKILEKVNNKYMEYSSMYKLASIYKKKGQSAKANQLYLELHKNLPTDNTIILSIARHYLSTENYNKALEFINKGLDNFPYSFVFLELKGDVYMQQNMKNEALKNYQKALTYNSQDSQLRTKISTITEDEGYVKKLKTQDIYDYIKTHRKEPKENNYGYSILLDESVTELYKEGGSIAQYTFAYHISSENGVEIFKEYNLGLSGYYNILKSEIVKANGKIIPADKSGSNLVFEGLEVGDVVYINYEIRFSASGRFYKDFVDYYQFEAFVPTTKTIYKIIVPNELNIQYEMRNGACDLDYKEEKDHKIYTWSLDNSEGLSMVEDLMPQEYDVAKYLHISTIESWNDISNWYSDLVRSQITSNSTVDETFEAIFPNGYKNLSDEEKAKAIYYYIMENINYSSVSFRQSGFIPQKPSKTIKTKLGDCKDVSTLFVTLAQKAELDANLVLVLTSDNGINALRLPSQNFNHCIVKTRLDNKDVFLELTDKYTPFKALPHEIINSTALEIPYNKSEDKTFDLFHINTPERSLDILKNHITINIEDNNVQKLNVKVSLNGYVNSYYARIFEEPNYTVVKEQIFEDFKTKLSTDFVLDSVYEISYSKRQSNIEYTSDIVLKEKINKIGKTRIYQAPKLSQLFTTYVIREEKRDFPINYLFYENIDQYETHYDIYINKNEVFTDIPEDLTVSYKGHRFSLKYKLVKDNHLSIDIMAKTDLSTISPEEYPEFKKYVKQILDSEESFLGFKVKS